MNLLFHVWVFLVLTTLKVADTQQENIPPSTDGKSTNGSYHVGVVCRHQSIGRKAGRSDGVKMVGHEKTKACCKKNGECKRTIEASKSFYYCLVKSKENEEKAKDCCSTTKKNDQRVWADSHKFDEAALKELQNCGWNK